MHKKKKMRELKNKRQKLGNKSQKGDMYRKQKASMGWLYQQRNVFPANIVLQD